MKAGLWWLCACAALAGCDRNERVRILTGEAMGTTYRIKTVGDAAAAKPAIGEMLAGLDRDLSTWRDDSWISGFNRAAAGTTMDMPESVAELLELSIRYHAETEGRFDPTIGALIRLWGFGAWRKEWRGEPADAEVAAARAASGFRNLRIDGSRIAKRHDGLMLDFSAIAKGYAVDRMGDILRDAGCHHFIIEFGGDILASGNAPGKRGWTVAGPALARPLSLHNEAVAASGSEHHFRDGLSHVIDPRSGRPVETGPPVSATAATCAEADALATARWVEAGCPIPLF